MALNAKLGFPVSTRVFSLLEMVAREWGSEFRSPDHRVYRFTGRDYDSTDLGTTGIYQHGFVPWTLDEDYVDLGNPSDTLDGSITNGKPPGG